MKEDQPLTAWRPVSFEDKLLSTYSRYQPGSYYLEVPIGSPNGPGNWPAGSKVRRIDAMRLPGIGTASVATRAMFSIDDFTAAAHGSDVELIEIKNRLDRVVIGQVLAGYDMFNVEYNPRSITSVVLCSIRDPALEWVCRQRGIRVFQVAGDWSGEKTADITRLC